MSRESTMPSTLHPRTSRHHPVCVVAFTCPSTLHTFFTQTFHHGLHSVHHRHTCGDHACRRRARITSPDRHGSLHHPLSNFHLQSRTPTIPSISSTGAADYQPQPSSIPTPSADLSSVSPAPLSPTSSPQIEEKVEDTQEGNGRAEYRPKGQSGSQTVKAPYGKDEPSKGFPIAENDSMPVEGPEKKFPSDDESVAALSSAALSAKKKPRSASGRTVAEIEARLNSKRTEQQRLANLAINRTSGDSIATSTETGDDALPDDETNDKGEDEIIFASSFSLSEQMRLEGHLAESNGEHGLACRLYWRATEIDIHNGKAWQNLAKCEGRRKRSLRSTANVLRQAISHNPQNPYLYQSLGFVLFRMKQYDEAREYFQRGIYRDPNHAPLYSTWAHLEYALRNVSKARQLYMKGCSLTADQPKPQESSQEPSQESTQESSSAPTEEKRVGVARVYHNWGCMELKLGNQERALELFDKGLEVEPYNCYIWETLGTLARKENDVDRARVCYENALKSDTKNVVVYEALAKLEESVGNIELARSIFETGIRVDFRDARILQSYAQLEIRQGRYEQARVQIEKAVLLNPVDSLLWTHYARIEVKLKHYPRARAMFNRACEINARDWRVWDAWSIMEYELGNHKQAEKLLHESFRIRFKAKGDFSILANSIGDRYIH